MSDVLVRLRVNGELFEVKKEILLRVKNTFFYGLLSSGGWQTDDDGAYLIDRPSFGFNRILEYLESGILSVKGMTPLEEECIYGNLDFFLIPYIRHWHYDTQLPIEGFSASYVIELKDGRLCGVCKNCIVVLNMDGNAIEITLNGHTSSIRQVLQLQDGRLCSWSYDRTIKLWNLASGVCELTMTGHTAGISCAIQLFDDRICSGSGDDETIRVWNISTGVCEMTLVGEANVYSLAQLSDGRICWGSYGGTISIHTLANGACELSWDSHSYSGSVNAFVCIDSTRLCSCFTNDFTIQIWSTVTGKRLITPEGHSTTVTSIVLLHDGRLCSTSLDGTIKLWNLETGECEKMLRVNGGIEQVMQLHDGRLIVVTAATVWICF